MRFLLHSCQILFHGFAFFVAWPPIYGNTTALADFRQSGGILFHYVSLVVMVAK